MFKRYTTLYSTQDKYQKVTKERPKPADHEIRIASDRFNMQATILKAAKYLIEGKNEFIVIHAIGNAIHKGVLLSEMLKHRLSGLHQICRITQTELEDQYIPIEEGLDTIIDKRVLTVLEITLTYNPKEQDKRDGGYQIPLPINDVDEIDLKNPEEKERTKRKRNRRRKPAKEEEYDEEDGYYAHDEDERRSRSRRNGGQTGNRAQSQGQGQRGQNQVQRQGEEQNRRQGEGQNRRQGAGQGQRQGQRQGKSQGPRQGQDQRQEEDYRQGQRQGGAQGQRQRERSQSQKRDEEYKVRNNDPRASRNKKEYQVKDDPQARTRSTNPKEKRNGRRVEKQYEIKDSTEKPQENGDVNQEQRQQRGPSNLRNNRSKSQGVIKKYQVKHEENEESANKSGWVNVNEESKDDTTGRKYTGQGNSNRRYNQGEGVRKRRGANRNYGYY